MAVYVDNAFLRFGRMRMCHMTADTMEELHEMADSVGIKREWFQDAGKYHHYDISKFRRAEAVDHGAVEVNRREFVEICRRLHEQGQFYK